MNKIFVTLFVLFVAGIDAQFCESSTRTKSQCESMSSCCWDAQSQHCMDKSMCEGFPSTMPTPSFPSFSQGFPSSSGNIDVDQATNLSSKTARIIQVAAGVLILVHLGIAVFAIFGWFKAQPKLRELLEYEKNPKPSTIADAISPESMERLEGNMSSSELSQLRWVGAKGVKPTLKLVVFIVMLCFGPLAGVGVSVAAILSVPKMISLFFVFANMCWLIVGVVSILFVKGCRYAEEIYGMTPDFCIIVRLSPWGSTTAHRFQFRSYEYMMVNPQANNLHGDYGDIIFADEFVTEETSRAVRGTIRKEKKTTVKKIGFQNVSRFNDSRNIFFDLHARARSGMPAYHDGRKEDLLPFSNY